MKARPAGPWHDRSRPKLRHDARHGRKPMQQSSMNPTHILRRQVLAAALLACTFAGSALAQEKLIPLRVGYDGYSMTTAPMNFALKKGIFKKHGIDLTLVYVDGGPTLTQAVVGGSVDIGQNGYTPVAAAAVAGADLVFIGGISNKLP